MATAAKAASPETLQTIANGRDIRVFARDVLGVDLNLAQDRWFGLFATVDGWDWLHRLILHVAANQVGKTLGIAIIILWACWNKIGVPTADTQAWLDFPYAWYHLDPYQQQAYLPLKDIQMLVEGTHPAQRRPCLIPKGFVRFVKQEQYYDGLEFWNGASAHFRTTDDRAKALQGRRASAISVDEAALEEHLLEIINTVLVPRLASTNGPLIAISTPNGINDWFEVVQAVIDSTPPKTPDADPNVWINDHGDALVWSTVNDNVGFGITAEYVERMERNTDESSREQVLRGAFVEASDAFFSPAPQALAAFRDVPSFEPPRPNHRYVIMWDPSVSSDPTAAIVIDVTTLPWRGVAFKYFTRAPSVGELLGEIYAVHAMFNGGGMRLRPGEKRPTAITGYDSTSMGGAMLRQQLSSITPQRAVNFAAGQKVNMLTNFRAAIMQGRVIFPKGWTRLQREVLNYRLKDEKLTQDTVMAGAGAVYLATSGFGEKHAAFRPMGRGGYVRA